MQGGMAGVVGAQAVHIENLYVGSTAPSASASTVGSIPLSPYPGLNYFIPTDSARFFGREDAITALTQAVARRSFTALVGASGSGKSSVVLAGLAPRLHAQGRYRFTYFRVGTEPDKNPYKALARALEPLTGGRSLSDTLEEVEKLAQKMASGSISLTNYIGQCRVANPGRRILLVADQFEEVFTLVSERALRERFINGLIAAFHEPTQGDAPDVCLVLTLRADFVSQAVSFRPLADRLKHRVEYLGPMTRDDLREAIVKPAEQVDPPVKFEPGLVDTILDDVEKRPGSLPLLQFALREMWARLKGPTMTRAEYDIIGGVEGALAKRGQAIFDNATRGGKDEVVVALFRRLFTRLVTLGEGAEDTRRIATKRELGPDEWSLAQKLANEDNRLIVTALATSGQETAEVVHEALIRNWPALVEWVQRDRAFLSWRNQLKQRVDEWRASPSDQGTLMRGGLLAVAEEWMGRHGEELNEEEEAFLATSVTAREAEKRRAEAELTREHERVVELRRQRANLFGALARAELERGNPDGALRLAVKGVREDLTLQSAPVVATRSMATLAAAVWQSNWHLTVGRTTEPLTCAAFSPDGSRIITASRDRMVRIWDTDTQNEIAVLRGHEDEVNSASFNTDGTRVVTGSDDATARIWDAEAAKEIGVLSGHEGGVNAASFSPDACRIVTASADKTARIWDALSSKEISVLRSHKSFVNAAAFSPNGKQIITASSDHTARIWDGSTGKEIGILRGHEAALSSAGFSPDGSRIVTASADKTARIWNVAEAREIAILHLHEDLLTSAVFSPDGSRIVTASTDKTARIWDVASAEQIRVLRGHESAVTSATFSRDGSRVITASHDGTSRVWNTFGKETAILVGHDEPLTSASYDPDGSRIVTTSADGTARVWSTSTSKEIAVLRGHEGSVLRASFSPDGSRVASSSEDMTVRIWEVETANQIAVLHGHESGIWDAAFSPDGTRIVTASRDKSARVWDSASCKELTILRGHGGDVTSAAFSPDGSRIVTTSRDATARIWDAATAKVVAVLRSPTDMYWGAFSPDGSRIATASLGGTASIWDTASGRQIAVLRGHGFIVFYAGFSPDGSRVVTASSDGSARIWDVVTGTEIAVLGGRGNWARSASFSPDGSHVVTASQDKMARIWDVSFATMPLDGLLDAACKRRLPGLGLMTHDEMRLAGYPDSEPLIDVCADNQIEAAR
jgi:WD40 repeat protein